MEKFIIDKNYLKGFKNLLVVLENCDVYEIEVENILDIYCEAKLINKSGNEYKTDDGFIKISALAKDTIECFIKKDGKIGSSWDHRLKERLQMCGGCADMTSFCLNDEQNRETNIFVQYDPLIDIQGNELEFSNCPSLEIDDEGNMIISFGERSKQPKRKDNNYAELIEGWKQAFGKYEPEILSVEIDSIYKFRSGNNITVCFKINDKKLKKVYKELVFIDCKDFDLEMHLPNDGKCDILISKMANGRIYVRFDGFEIEFFCSSICEYVYYQDKQDKKGL